MNGVLGNLAIIIFALSAFSHGAARAAEATVHNTEFTRKTDVVYSRSYGTALTMDIFEPKKNANGATVVWVISGGWFSSHDSITTGGVSPVPLLIDHGYRVCAVVHRSSPYFTIEHAVTDIRRAIRYIHYTDARDGRATDPIGIMGGSAGGHLSLMAGATGDDGDPKAKDPVERASSRVQAVACYFPPTDFLNYGATHVNVMETSVGVLFPASFEFREQRVTSGTIPAAARFEDITDPAKIRAILKEVSPAQHVTPDDAPTFIMHGDADPLVPIQQSELFIKELKQAGVDAKLVRKKGKGHGWIGLEKDNATLVDWLDKHLLNDSR